jgi:hypothetical protein
MQMTNKDMKIWDQGNAAQNFKGQLLNHQLG